MGHSEEENTAGDAGTKAARGGQEESTDGSDLRQGGTFPLMVSPGDKVDDVRRRIINSAKSRKNDVHMTCEG